MAQVAQVKLAIQPQATRVAMEAQVKHPRLAGQRDITLEVVVAVAHLEPLRWVAQTAVASVAFHHPHLWLVVTEPQTQGEVEAQGAAQAVTVVQAAQAS